MKNPVLFQEWKNLLFLHWKMNPNELKNSIPSSLSLDTFQDSAWVGIIAFEMINLRPKYFFPISFLSNFPEINLRTYVKDKHGNSGVWFFSLDTSNVIANYIANTFFYLNYRYGRTKVINEGQTKHDFYLSHHKKDSDIQKFIWEDSQNHFKPVNDKDSIEYFLTERYRLYCYNYRKNRLYSGCIKHENYLLNKPTLKSYSTKLFASNKISVPNSYPDSVLSSNGVTVEVFPLELA